MSFIFDALRKSEAQRRETGGPRPAAQFNAPEPTRWPRLLAGGLLLAALGAGLGWYLARPATSVPAAPTTPKTADTARPRPETVRPLAEEAAAARTAPAMVQSDSEPAEDPPTETGPRESTATATKAVPLAALPAELRAALPTLNMQVHAFAADPAQRFVIINLHRYHEGDRVAPGVRLLAVRPEGAVLSFRDHRFLLSH